MHRKLTCCNTQSLNFIFHDIEECENSETLNRKLKKKKPGLRPSSFILVSTSKKNTLKWCFLFFSFPTLCSNFFRRKFHRKVSICDCVFSEGILTLSLGRNSCLMFYLTLLVLFAFILFNIGYHRPSNEASFNLFKGLSLMEFFKWRHQLFLTNRWIVQSLQSGPSLVVYSKNLAKRCPNFLCERTIPDLFFSGV